MPANPISREAARAFLEAVAVFVRDGAPIPGETTGKVKGAVRRAAEFLGVSRANCNSRYLAACRILGEPDWEAVRRGGGIVFAETEAPPKPRFRVQATSVKTETPKPKALPPPAFLDGPRHIFKVDANHRFAFGAVGDSHMGSKYERLDVLERLYSIFAEEGITTVFHTGNWIDGEARFNVHDLRIHGMHAQCAYLARHYPQRDGICTYAVTGDDHEGWYGQREGVDIGAYAEQQFRKLNRHDWIDLGFMEASVLLRHPDTGVDARVAIVHPGGGSAYAVSYTIQKIIESLDGGEKPAIGLYGHYHKLWFGNIRNVWCVQTGCSQDQSPFMRKKRIDAHIGGALVRGVMDPETGAIVRCSVELIRFFNRGYYDHRWSPSGDVRLPERTLAGV